ncbi:MAG TPA: metal ABC transporter permease, partial [Candidatus Lokiarchaeia archaeon]|nr:metal ABC transporter permease [Candidatus Lokiarchaeia archaeon]
TRLLGIIFMLLVAVTTSIAVQVVGVLLIFALMVTPAAIAQKLARKPGQAILISVTIALVATWLGLIIAYYTPYPVSFFITSIVFALYLLVNFIYPWIKSAMVQKSGTQNENLLDEARKPNIPQD